jgi:GT2 family glycosyltransferase
VGPVRVSAIVTTWNAAEVLGRCLASLERQVVTGGFETIVVDNASTDGTRELLAQRAERLHVVTNDHNAHYSGGNNRGAAAARGTVLFFLNPDTELLDPYALDRLAAAVEQPGVGIAGPMLVNPDGSLQPSCAAHPSLLRALVIGSGLQRLLPNTLLLRIDPERWSHDRPVEVGWVKGAAIAIRADLFAALDGFWPAVYGQEEDLAYRAQRRGFRVRFEPSVRVMHVGNFSSAQRWNSAERASRVAHAELLLLREHYGPLRRSAIRVVVGAGYAARAAAHAVLGRSERAALFRAMARTYTSIT